MIHHQRTLTIDASVDAVWAVLSRFMHIDEIAPLVTSVDALTQAQGDVGAKRRCHFEDGNSLVEEVISWEENRGYRVRLLETDPMPLKKAFAELRLKSQGPNKTQVIWSMDYQIKYGPFGWLLGQTMMKMMMSKVLDGNLKGLAGKVQADFAEAA